MKELIAAAKAGGEILRRRFGNHGRVSRKSTAADVQTEADLEAERVILEELGRAFPDASIVAEESGRRDGSSRQTLVVDPLDGTNNFVLGIPHFAVSLALLEAGQLAAAVVHQPILRQTFWASRAGGAWQDGARLQVNQQGDVQQATVAQVYPYRVTSAEVGERTDGLWQLGCRRVLLAWAPALDFCLLASGKIEAIVHFGSEFYDYAAGKLIAREAGARVTTLDGKPESDDSNRLFVASNGTALHDQLIAVISRYDHR